MCSTLRRHFPLYLCNSVLIPTKYPIETSTIISALRIPCNLLVKVHNDELKGYLEHSSISKMAHFTPAKLYWTRFFYSHPTGTHCNITKGRIYEDFPTCNKRSHDSTLLPLKHSTNYKSQYPSMRQVVLSQTTY